MSNYHRELTQIKDLLKANPRGLTVTDLSRRMGLNRNSVSKYLEMLVVAGQVEMKMQGPSKVFFLSRRMPISAMLSLSSDIIIVVDRELRIQYVNEPFYQLTHASREAIVGKKVDELNIGGLNHHDLVSDLRATLNGREFVKEMTIDRDGTAHYFRARFVPAVLAEGGPCATIIIEDITKSRQSEEALKTSEQKYRQLVELAHEGIWAFNSRGVLTFANPRIAEMLGYAVEDMIGKPIQTFFRAADEELVRKKLEMRLQGFNDHYDIELLRKDGNTIFASIRATPVKDERDSFSGAFAVVSDISGRKSAELALKASEKKYRQLVELAQEGIWAVDAGWTTTFVNPRMAEMLGYTVEEIVGKPIFNFMDRDSQEIARKNIKRREIGIKERLDFELIRKDGIRIFTSMDTAPIFDSAGTFQGSMALVTDITQKKRMEEELRRAHDDLSIQVSVRTSELDAAVKSLRRENLERRIIEDALRMDEARLEALLRLNAMTDASTEEMVSFVLEKAVELTSSKVGFINSVDEDKKIAVNLGYSKDTLRLCRMEKLSLPITFDLVHGGLWVEPVRQRKPVIINDYAAYPGIKTLPADHFAMKRFMGVPVFNEGRIVAIAMVGNKEHDYNSADVRQLSLLMSGLWQTILRKQALEALSESEARLRLTFDRSPVSKAIVALDMRIMQVNEAFCKFLGYPAEEFTSRYVADITYPKDLQKDMALAQQLVAGEIDVYHIDKRYICKDGRIVWGSLSAMLLRDNLGRPQYVLGEILDVTDRKLLEMEQDSTVEFLKLANESQNTKDLIHATTEFFQQQSGCEAVGIRIQEGADYPYHETRGFGEEFVLAESRLCAYDDNGHVICDGTGNPVLECMCGNVICGRFDPSKPFFTAKGSFWTNSTTDLLASTTEADRMARTRNRCNGEGYESVALIPVHLGEKRFGLIQLNDRRKGRFSIDYISCWERLSDYLAVALAKFSAEDKLQESGQMFRLTFDQSPLGAAIADLDYRYQRVNAALCNFLGYTESELLAQTMPEITHPDDGQANLEISRAMAAGTIDEYHVDNRYIRKNGTIAWGRLSVRMVKDATGKQLYYMTLVEDITELKQAEHALMESEEKFAKAFKCNPSLIVIMTADESRIVEVNESIGRMTGYTRAEVIGKTPDELGITVPGQRSKALRLFSKAGRWDNVEFTIAKRTGDTVIVIISAESIEINGKQHMILTINDITELRKAEDARREIEERYRMIVETINEGIGIIDRSGKLTYLNEQLARISGYNREELLGRSIFDYMGEDSAGIAIEVLKERNTGIGGVAEYEVRRKDGRNIWARINSTPLYDGSGHIMGTLAMVTDITNQRLMEQSLKESEAQFRSFVEQSFDGIMLIDEQGKIVEYNRQMEEITGLKRESLIGMAVWDYLYSQVVDERKTPEHYEAIKAMVLSMLEIRQSPMFNVYETKNIRLADGTIKKLQLLIFPITIGEHFMIGCISRDMTDDHAR